MTTPNPKQKKTVEKAKDAAALHVGAAAASSQAAATDAWIDGMGDLLNLATTNGHKRDATTFVDGLKDLGLGNLKISPGDRRYQRQGHLFEAIVNARENAGHARSGSGWRAAITHIEGNTTARADRVLRSGHDIVREYQCKYSVRPSHHVAGMVAQTHYEGMTLEVPSDKVEQTRAYLMKKAEHTPDPGKAEFYRGVAKRLRDPDVSTVEVKIADLSPELYAFGTSAMAVGTEAAQAGASVAVVSGAIATAVHTFAVVNGSKTLGEAAADVAKGTGKSFVKSASTQAGSTLVRHCAKEVGLKALTKANVAAAVADVVIQVGHSVYRLAKGEITAEQAMEEMGQSGFCGVAAFYGGVAGSMFGPLGTAAGSMAGYLIAAATYQSCIAVFKNADLAEAEAARLIPLLEDATAQLRIQRAAFGQYMTQYLGQQEAQFNACFAAIDEGLAGEDVDLAIDGMNRMAALLGKTLKLSDFDEFDAFMLHSNEPLRL